MKIAIIGSGIAGNAAAWALYPQHDITIYERRLRPGGHSATLDIDYDGMPISVDTGFIVYNTLNYPKLTALFEHLNVATEESSMSFSVSVRGGVQWQGQFPNGIFAQKRNLFSPSFLWMLREILRFNHQCIKDLASGALNNITLGEYLLAKKYSKQFCDQYLIPLGAAIWSTPASEMLKFPAENFVQFCNNHRLLHYKRPKWRTVSGGSRNYVDKLIKPFRRSLRLGCEVISVTRSANGVYIKDSYGDNLHYDQVIIASHTDQTLRMLSEASKAEKDILSSIQYRPNIVYLHRDKELMPQRKAVWASWNYLSWSQEKNNKDSKIAVTYWMNRLQNIDKAKPLFVSLNPPYPPRDELTFATMEYDHPQFDRMAMNAQKQLENIQGIDRTWFCGAWTGYGFHEDGLASGLDIAKNLGAVLPWEKSNENYILNAAE